MFNTILIIFDPPFLPLVLLLKLLSLFFLLQLKRSKGSSKGREEPGPGEWEVEVDLHHFLDFKLGQTSWRPETIQISPYFEIRKGVL